MGDFFVAPGGAAEWAVIGAGVVLIAGELAVFAERGEVEVVAVAIEAILSEVLVVFDAIFGAELAGFGPGACFDFEELDIRMVVGFLDEVVAELVEQQKIGFIRLVFAV